VVTILLYVCCVRRLSAFSSPIGRRRTAPPRVHSTLEPSLSPSRAPPLSPAPSFSPATTPPPPPPPPPLWCGQHVTVVTTAALPWMTGTSVNPLLRAVELARQGAAVTLLLPWLDPHDALEGQPALFGSGGQRFANPSDQESWIRKWVREREGDDDGCNDEGEGHGKIGGSSGELFAMHWYPARYAHGIGSIIHDDRKGGSILEHLPDREAVPRGVVVLEEPEHLCWYHCGGRWSDEYPVVVGVVHTDYMQYARTEGENAACKTKVTYAFQSLAYQAHCDVLVCLSKALEGSGAPPHLTVYSNCHGVRRDFLQIGQDCLNKVKRGKREGLKLPRVGGGDSRGDTSTEERGDDVDDVTAAAGPFYFLAKKLWTKGYRELLDLLTDGDNDLLATPPLSAGARCRALLADLGPLLLVGSGPDEDEIATEAARRVVGAREEEDTAAAATHGEGNSDAGNRGSNEHGGGDDGDERLRRGGGGPLAELVVCRGAADHASFGCLDKHPVFVNPSVSEVLCTATAEALAMGKIVVIPRVPSNEFFYQFPNCLVYDCANGFADCLEEAAAKVQKRRKRAGEEGTPQSWSADDGGGDGDDDDRLLLSWDAATARLATAVEPLLSLLPPPALAPPTPLEGATPLPPSQPPLAPLSRRPTDQLTSRLAHQANLFFRFGLVGRVLHYDFYMVLEEWDESEALASWVGAVRYLLGLGRGTR